MHVARCLMRVRIVERVHAGLERLTLTCEYDKDNPKETAFARATPSGEFTFDLTNPELIGSFVPGALYFVELLPKVVPVLAAEAEGPASIDVALNELSDVAWVPCVSIGQLLQSDLVPIAERAAKLHSRGREVGFLVVFKGEHATQAYSRSSGDWRAANLATWKPEGGDDPAGGAAMAA